MTQDSPSLIWRLHQQLAQDCVSIGDLTLSRVLILRDGAYPWLLLVPRRAGASEFFDLATADRAHLVEEIALAARVLKAATGCDKINIGALGNLVPQLHVHIVARRAGDPAWPGPVWGHAPMQPCDPVAFKALRTLLEKQLPLTPLTS